MSSTPSTPRRSARIQGNAPSSSPTLSPSTPTKEAAPRSLQRSSLGPFLPTSLESILLAVYPITLIIGSLVAVLDPVARAAPYNPVTQSHYANTAPSYFAKKTNVFNIFFVKRGWAWVTFAYFYFLFTHPSTGKPWTIEVTHRRLRGTLRHALVTVWWIFVTQWFFGPAIIDRGFILTGGQCALAHEAEKGNIEMNPAEKFVTGMACKASGGKWAGGHDISGHVFLLVLGSLFLLEEVLHVTLKSTSGDEERTVVMADGAVKSAHVETDRLSDLRAETSGQWTLGAKFAVGVSTLSVYMLLMTAAYFHTWFEKLTGLLVALTGIFVVYYLPRGVPVLRNVIGLPGI